jgi:hypothetical protein
MAGKREPASDRKPRAGTGKPAKAAKPTTTTAARRTPKAPAPARAPAPGQIRVTERARIDVELTRIARLLGVAEKRIGYLEALGLDGLRDLRFALTDELFDSNAEILERLARASRLLPMGLVATLGQSIFGPIVSARITAVSDPDRAAQLAGRLPVPFLADVCAALDPRKTQAVVSRIRDDVNIAVAEELYRRGDYPTMAQMAGLVSMNVLAAILPKLDDRSVQLILTTADDPGRVREIREMRSG